MGTLARVVLAAVVVLAFTVPVAGAANAVHWLAGEVLGQWTVHTTPNYKGHSPAGMHAVCVNSITDAERVVPITPAQAYGDTATAALLAGAPCPA